MSVSNVAYRTERAGDASAVRTVVEDAFQGAPTVGELVDALRRSPDWVDGLSFVADLDGEVIGHVLFTRSLLDAPQRLVDVLVLSPVSVARRHQGRGIGSGLVRHGLDAVRRRLEPLVFLEGDPAFYRRFDFEPAGPLGFRRPSLRIPEPAFQVLRLSPYEPWMTGTLVYSRVFWDLDCVGLRDGVPQATAPARAGNRTGPISRVYRLALVLLLGWAVIGLLGEGIAGFSEAPVPNQPILWILTALAFIGFHDAAEMWLRGRGRLAVIVAGAVLVGAAGVSLVTAGQLWDAPLTWLLYGFDLGIASLVLVAAAVSIVTGTPGCELGALSELVARFRGSYDPDVPIVHACAGGLHRLDRWESRQDRD